MISVGLDLKDYNRISIEFLETGVLAYLLMGMKRFEYLLAEVKIKVDKTLL